MKRNIQIIIAISLVVKLFGILYRFLIARFLNIEGMMIFSLLSPILSLSLCLSSLSIPVVINQRVSLNLSRNTYSNRSLILSALRITIISSSLVSIALILGSYPLSHFLYKNDNLYYPIIMTIPIIYFSNFSGILKGYFEAHNHFKYTQTSNLVEQIVKIVICIGLVAIFRDKSINFLICLIVIGLSLSEVSSFTYLIIKTRKFTSLKFEKNFEETSPILKQATPLTISHLITSFFSFLEPIVFTYSLSKINYSSDVAQRYFTLFTGYAVPLLLMAFFVTGGITKAFFPNLCKCKENKKETNNLISKSLFLATFTSIINFNINYYFADELLSFLYKNNESASIVQFLAPFYFIFYFSPIFVSVLQAHNHEKKLLRNNVISTCITLFFIFILCQIPAINTLGFAISVIITNLIYLMLNYSIIHHDIGYKIKIKSIILVGLLTLINIYQTKYLLLVAPKIMAFLLGNITTILILVIYYRIKFKPSEE